VLLRLSLRDIASVVSHACCVLYPITAVKIQIYSQTVAFWLKFEGMTVSICCQTSDIFAFFSIFVAALAGIRCCAARQVCSADENGRQAYYLI
jgi:hypothetical protein